jgi:hypothetical protein
MTSQFRLGVLGALCGKNSFLQSKRRRQPLMSFEHKIWYKSFE